MRGLVKRKFISIPALNLFFCLPISARLRVLCVPSYFSSHQLPHLHILSVSAMQPDPQGFLFNLTSMRYQFLCREILQIILLFMTPVTLPFQRSQLCILKILSFSYHDISPIKLHLILNFCGKVKVSVRYQLPHGGEGMEAVAMNVKDWHYTK